jgi:hypothetical protein
VWGNFWEVRPFGVNFAELESLQNGYATGSVIALLLMDYGHAPVTPATAGSLAECCRETGKGYLGRRRRTRWRDICCYGRIRTVGSTRSRDGNRMWLKVER